MGVGLGFSVAGGVDQNKPVTVRKYPLSCEKYLHCKCIIFSLFICLWMSSSQVHKVFHSGVAAQEGSIREGDQVLSINGTSLCDCVHWEALRILRRAKTRNMGVVVLRRGGISSAKGREQRNNPGPTQTQFTETGQRSYFTWALKDIIPKSAAFKVCFPAFLLSQVSVCVCVWRRTAGIWASACREVLGPVWRTVHSQCRRSSRVRTEAQYLRSPQRNAEI